MDGKLNPSALSINDAVKVLQAAGARHVSTEKLQADVDAGAPTNPDRTLNLVHYAAWLVARLANGGARPAGGQEHADPEIRADGRSDARGED
jgi:hypothetical protein